MPPILSRDLSVLLNFDCVVLRGLPGSGKTTLARRLAEEHGFRHFEADHHFVVNGVYRFDPARVADAHAVVARDTLAALQAGEQVVVANTHVRLWEMVAVVGACDLVGRRYCVVQCNGRWPNGHDVPEAVMASMATRWESWPSSHAAPTFVFP